jgi:hypothetical protein
MPKLSYALWSIWIELPLLHKLFLFLLFVVGIYSLFSATKILAGVRSVMASGQSRDVSAFQNELAVLYARSANVRQLITATFYLFGIVFFWGLRFTLWTPDGKTSVFQLVLENFFLYFAFAANVFSIFFVLHSVQWFVSARLHAYAKRLTTSRIRIAKNPT